MNYRDDDEDTDYRDDRRVWPWVLLLATVAVAVAGGVYLLTSASDVPPGPGAVEVTSWGTGPVPVDR